MKSNFKHMRCIVLQKRGRTFDDSHARDARLVPGWHDGDHDHRQFRVGRSQRRSAQQSVAALGDRGVPVWVDGTLERAVHPNPLKRYDSLSEFLFDLRQPNANYVKSAAAPLIERNPLLFWKSTTIVLALAVIVLLAMLHGMHR